MSPPARYQRYWYTEWREVEPIDPAVLEMHLRSPHITETKAPFTTIAIAGAPQSETSTAYSQRVTIAACPVLVSSTPWL